MIDERYTALVKAAYEAQQAREGDTYKSLTSELATIDGELEALAAKREQAVASLESMDAAVVAAQEALQAHFRNQLVTLDPTKGAQWASEEITTLTAGNPEPATFHSINPFTADEFSSSRANGAYTED